MERLGKTTTVKLFILMFLQFFIWGCWYTSVAIFMTTEGMGELTHWPFTVNPVAAIVAPFFVGLIADRFFATQKVLGILHLLGGAVLLLIPQFTSSPSIFILMLLIYNLCYMPTLALANSLVFHNISNQEKNFPYIRVFGTIGWIAAGLFISFGLGKILGTQAEPTHWPLTIAAIGSVVLGLFSFSLPHTPPAGRDQKVSFKSILGWDAMTQLQSRKFYVFLVSSFLISIPLAAYYNFTQLYLQGTGFENIAGVQTIGQFSEVIFILLMPMFFIRLGVKKMLVIGMFAWGLRYALFALGAPDQVSWMILTGIALHGICYDFFFVTGQIYVDKKSSPQIRGQAQGLLVLVTYGLGMLVGAQLAGELFNSYLQGADLLSLSDWQSFWWWPAIMSFGVMILFGLTFTGKEES
jgi:nucleoside transporter